MGVKIPKSGTSLVFCSRVPEEKFKITVSEHWNQKLVTRNQS